MFNIYISKSMKTKLFSFRTDKSLKTTILCGFLIMLPFSIIIGILANYSIFKINNDYVDGIHQHSTPLKALMDVETAFGNIRQTTRAVIIRINVNPSEYETQAGRVTELINTMSEKLDILIKTFNGLDKNNDVVVRSNAMLLELQNQFNVYIPTLKGMLEVSKTGNLKESIEFLDTTRSIASGIADTILKVYDLNVVAIENTIINNSNAANSFKTKLIIFVLIAFILGLIFAIVIANAIADKMFWFESMLNAVSEPISATDMDKNITFLNKPALDILGKTAKETLDRNCGSVWGVEICKNERCGIEYLKCGKGKSVFNVGDFIFTTDANYIKDRKGHNVGHIEVVANITKEIEMKQELEDKIFWFESILNSISEPISATDMNKNITFLNKPALDILGKTAKDTIGKNCGSVWGVEICKDERCGIEHLKCGKGKSIFNVGDVFFSTDASYLKDNKGNNVGHVEVVSNISSEHHKKMYNEKAVDKLALNIKKLSEGNIDIDLTLEPPNEYTQSEYKHFKEIALNLEQVHNSIEHIVTDVAKLAESLKAGSVGFRVDSTKHKGNFKLIIDGMNNGLNGLLTPFQEVADVLEEMASGNLTVKVEGDYQNDMNNLKDDVNHLGASLTDLVSQLQEAIHTTASAASQISATAETLATATQKQSSQANEVANAMENMTRTVSGNANSAMKTADVAKQSGEVANSGGKVVEQTVTKMREISEVVRSSAENIAKLGESSKKIGEIISVIDDIADQTNLLSLNAAIEAARAGEQGRGFAVVADSVGKLAIRTASATKEIADMIKGIQMDTESAVRAMEKGTLEVNSGIELADNAGNSIQSILTGITDLLNMINHIASASEEQSTTSEQISKNVSAISKVIAESAKNVEDVASTANELAKMTDVLTSLVSQFKVNVLNSSNSNSHSNTLRNNNDRYLEN